MCAKKSPKKSSKKKRALVNKRSMEDEGDYGPDIPSHKHCVNCGVSIDPDKETCSDRCQVEWDKMIKRKKFWNYLPIIGALFLALIWVMLLVSS